MAVTDFKCALALCEHQCQTTKALIAHLKEHIVEGRAVTRPVRGCTDVFHPSIHHLPPTYHGNTEILQTELSVTYADILLLHHHLFTLNQTTLGLR